MTIGEVRRVNLPAFTVIGKEGKGLAQDGSSWVPPLWEIVNEKIIEVAEEVATEPASIHLWGLMSDEEVWLAPWNEVGRYLAGIAVPAATPVPEGWQKWEMPAMSYLVVKTNSENLASMTEEMLAVILPKEQAILSAAIQEHYLPEFEDGEVDLYFPVAYSQQTEERK